jgi:hypothetical protein
MFNPSKILKNLDIKNEGYLLIETHLPWSYSRYIKTFIINLLFRYWLVYFLFTVPAVLDWERDQKRLRLLDSRGPLTSSSFTPKRWAICHASFDATPQQVDLQLAFDHCVSVRPFSSFLFRFIHWAQLLHPRFKIDVSDLWYHSWSWVVFA